MAAAARAPRVKPHLSGPLVGEGAARRGHAPALAARVSASRPGYPPASFFILVLRGLLFAPEKVQLFFLVIYPAPSARTDMF